MQGQYFASRCGIVASPTNTKDFPVVLSVPCCEKGVLLLSGSGPRFPGREELINEGPFPLRPEPRRRGTGALGALELLGRRADRGDYGKATEPRGSLTRIEELHMKHCTFWTLRRGEDVLNVT